MATHEAEVRILSVKREIGADPATIFELIADPAQQPRWDGNDNLAEAAPGQRVRGTGEIFTITLAGSGSVRDNRVVEFTEGRLIAWMPGDAGQEPAGHLWRWELEPVAESRTLVTHTYDWTGLPDDTPAARLGRARRTTPDMLRASLDRLAALAESA